MKTNYNFSEEELLRLEESFQANYEYEHWYDYEDQAPEGDVFTLENFIEAVSCGCFTDYDGFGYLSPDGIQKRDLAECNLNWLNAKLVGGYFKYVIWFNK